MNKRTILLIALVCLGALVWGMTCFVQAYAISHPNIVIPTGNRDKFVHACVLLDTTGSFKSENLDAAKRVIEHGLINPCGPEDTLVTFAVGPEFTIKNTIFGRTYDEQMHLPSAEMRDRVLRVVNRNRESSQRGVVDDEMYDLVHDLEPYWAQFAGVRRKWTESLNRIKRPARGGSEICAAINAIEQDFRSRSEKGVTKVLFVFSDLVQNAHNVQRCDSSGSDTLDDVQLVIVYPYDSDQDWAKIEAFWREFFHGKEFERLPLSDAQRRRFLIAPNPVAGLEDVRVPGLWESFQAALLLHRPDSANTPRKIAGFRAEEYGVGRQR